jgi:uncharacterized protein with HEPN domain
LSPSDLERLADILGAADEVAELVKSSKDVCESDRTRRLAVERLLEIIGEAARAMSEERGVASPMSPGETSSGSGRCSLTTISVSITSKCE